jgi:hypothetical protein
MTKNGTSKLAEIAAHLWDACAIAGTIEGHDREELSALMMKAGESGLPCWREIESLAQMLEEKAAL